MISIVPELPLLKRELIELAHRKRTYALRCLCLAVFSLVFLTFYIEMHSYAVNLMAMLGRGREFTMVLFVTLSITIYALGPAMACSAITAEKEKQTLGLLILSRLQPWAIVLEKVGSRMVPLMTLLIVAAPLFSIAYLFGGVTFEHSVWGIGVLVFMIFQVTVVAVFCSALLETGMAAFWATYFILFVLYFSLPLLVEAHFLPRPPTFGSLSDLEFLFFPIYHLVTAVEYTGSRLELLLMMLPSLAITIGFLIATRFAVLWFSYGGAFSFAGKLRRVQVFGLRRLEENLGHHALRTIVKNVADRTEVRRVDAKSLAEIENLPICWREHRRLTWKKPSMMALLITILMFMEGSVLTGLRNSHQDFCALFTFGAMIISLLMVIGSTCRLFAKEREGQTLDSLLVSPLSNHAILQQKKSAVNWLIAVLMLPMIVTNLFNLAYTTLRVPLYLEVAGASFPQSARSGSAAWIVAAGLYLTLSLGCAFIYMHLVKWIALFFGLQMKTQIKAMVGTLITVLSLCFIPMLMMTLVMISVDSSPDDVPFWFFSTPLISFGINEFHDLHEIVRRNWLSGSELSFIVGTFCVYGGLTLIIRRLVIARLQVLLNRRDQPRWESDRTMQGHGTVFEGIRPPFFDPEPVHGSGRTRAAELPELDLPPASH